MKNSDIRKSGNRKFGSDEQEIVINHQPSNPQSDDDGSFQNDSNEDNYLKLNHKDFTSSDLKEDEVVAIDPRLVAINNNQNERRLKRNSNSLESEKQKAHQYREETDDTEETTDDRMNLKKNKNKLVKNKMYDNKPSMERISEVEEDKYNTIIDKHNDGINREEFKIDDKKFDEFMNKNINSSQLKEYFDPQSNNTDSTYRMNKEMSNYNKLSNPDQIARNTGANKRIEDDLYKDAINRKKKKEMIEENNVMNILLNSNKTKISNNSHKIALNKIEKYIEYIIFTYDQEKTKKISFFDLGNILTELKVFREIFKKETKVQNEYSSYKEIKMELKNVRDNEKRRKVEIDFYEQIWILLNPDNNEFIKVNILAEFLKILFSPVSSSVKEISSVLRQFLQTAFFLNSNAERKQKFISPITEKSISEEEIWSLDKLVKEFLKLKQNILAYQSINNVSKKMLSELEQKSFPFSPQINNSKSDKNRPKFFEGRLDALLDREKIKRQVYEETKKDMEEEKLKECTFKPKVTKTYDPTKSTEQIPVYLKLFKLQAEKSEKLAKQREMEEKNKALEEVAQYPFQPALESNYKFFESSKNKEKPYKYDEAVDRLRMAAQKKFQQKKMLEHNFDSKKYERVMKNKDQIRPFDITDMKKAPKLKDEKEEAKRREREKKEKEKKKAEEEAFSIQISVAKGKERLLRIKKSDDPREVAENFCRVYGLRNEDVLDRLTSTIRDFMNIYLTNNDNFDLQNNMEPDIFDNMESNLNLNQLQTNNINNTNINLSKELAASKASI